MMSLLSKFIYAHDGISMFLDNRQQLCQLGSNNRMQGLAGSTHKVNSKYHEMKGKYHEMNGKYHNRTCIL